MGYFITHVGYVVVAAIFVAVLGLLTVHFREKSMEENIKHGYDPAWDKSEFACPGCKFVGVCNGMASLKPKDEDEFRALKAQEEEEAKKTADAILTEFRQKQDQ